MFNLYLNTFEINEDILNLNILFIINTELKNFYSFGCSNYYNSSDFEIYRLIMNFIFYYYKNFLYRLVRYRYILDYKNYTLLKFFKRYFNIVDWFYHSYFRFRWLIHKYIFFGNYIKKTYYKFFKFRYIYSYRVRKLAFLPFWFYFDNFTKIFMYVVLNKFYIKSNFLLYWFYVNYNFNYIYICIFYYNFKYYLLNYSKNLFGLQYIEIDLKILRTDYLYWINMLNLNDNMKQYVISIAESLVVFFVFLYNKLIIDFNYYACLGVIYSKIKNIFIYFSHYISIFFLSNAYLKWYVSIILKSYSIIWWDVFHTHISTLLKLYFLKFNVKVSLNLKNIIFIKYYISKLLFYYVKIIFNIKNSLVYFKPSYYNFRQQKNLRYTKKFKVYFKSNFASTRTVRNIYSLKHYTNNMNFFKNISFFNLYNYLYLMNSYDMNLLNISTNLFIILKNQSIIYIIFIYFLIYFSIFILLFIMYHKFYNIFFFCRVVNNDLQDAWEKTFLNNKTSFLLKNTTKMKVKYFNHLWRRKKIRNFFNFVAFNVSIAKKKFIQQLLFKIFIKDKIYKKFKEKFNNNYIIIIKNAKLQLDYSTILYKIYDFMKLVNIRHHQVIKEKKTFKFYFYDFLNSNILNLCFLYWLILVPYFFFEYILMRYHLKGHIRIKRRYFLFFKVGLNNFKFYIQLSKMMGLNNYSTSHKRKSPRNYLNASRYRRKRKLKLGFFFKWDRFNTTLVRLSSLGNYFYWFSHINKWEYFLSYKKYFFNFSYNSNYFYFIYTYLIFLLVKLWNFKKYNKCRI